jgi:hypothetical protein
MEPKFIQGQIQQSSFDDETSSIRPGVVWMLRNVSMIVVSNNTRATSSSSSDERLKRMLLVSGDNIVRIWRPGGNKNDKKQSETVQQHSTIDTHDDRRRNESDLTTNGDPNQTQQDASPDSSARKQCEVVHTPHNMTTSQSQDAPVDESTAALWDQLRRSSKPLAAIDENRNSIYKNREIPSFNNCSQTQEEFDAHTALQNRPLHTGPSLNTQESNVRNVYPLGDDLTNNKPSSSTEGSSQESSSEVHHHTQESTSKKKKKKGKDKERREKPNKRSKEDIVIYATTQDLSPTGKKETFIVNDNNKGSVWNMSEDTTLLQMIEEDYKEQRETLSNSNQTRDVNESNPPCKGNDSSSDQDVQGSGNLFVHNTDDWDGMDLDDDGLI